MNTRHLRPMLAAAIAGAAGAGLRADTLTLAEAHAMALRNHPQVSIGLLRERIAQEIVKQDRAAYFPTVDGLADGIDVGNRDTRILAGGLNDPSVYDRVADGVAGTELITDFGQTRNRVAGAKLEARAAGENSASVNEQILLSVDVNYFGALEAQAVLQVARDTVASRRLLANQVSALARNQLRSALDVSFAQVALQQSRLLLQKAEGDLSASEASLSAALGYRETRHFVLADVAPPEGTSPDVGGLIDAAMKNRPDLLSLRDQRSASERLSRAARDRNYPTLAAVGMVGNAISHDYRLPNKYAVGAITLDFPLFEGGSYEAQEKEAELNTQVADQALRDQEDNVGRDVRLAWINLNTARQQLQTTEDLLTYANQAYDLARARYKIGSSSIVELSDAQVSATSAQIATANARYDELLRQSMLDYETGSLR